MDKLEFKNIRCFEKGTIYNILKEAYSFDEKYYLADGETKWKHEADAFFFDNLHIADTCVFITTLNNEPIGVVMWDPRDLPEFATIGHNGIVPKYKGKSFGKIQMKEAIKRIKDAGAQKILVSTNADLMPAMKNYESVGFKEVACKPSEYKNFADDVYYELSR